MFSLTNYVIALLVAVGLIILYFAWLFMRNPVLIKVGLRNIPRRPAQSALIVMGLTLSTIIILASLALGDTLNYSLRRQAVDAYGAIDEVLAPPLISALLASGGDDAAMQELEAQFGDLTAGGLDTVLSLVDGGLPGISEARFRELQVQAEDEPLIDGVAGSILFPTIIRNVTSGQGEPFGFVFAVDEEYDSSFGLYTTDGEPAEMERLQPGAGNIFVQSTQLFATAREMGAQLGLGEMSVSQVATLTAGLGAILTGAAGGEFDVGALEMDVATLRSLGIDTTALEEAGMETLSLDSLAAASDLLTGGGAGASGAAGGAAQLPLDTESVQALATDLLGSLNLTTVGRELDSLLGRYGLQVRQGDVYLNRLGAERLNARVGDVLEIYVGPIPLPYRVAGIVEQAGPTAALAPVAVMRLDEAQKVFFMPDRVNNILVSNQGDEMEGMQLTSDVNARLRILALDEEALEEVVAVLRRPSVAAAIAQAAPGGGNDFQEEFDGPAFIGDYVAGLFNLAEFNSLRAELPAALAEPGINATVRQALANTAMRDWLLGLDIAPTDRADLSAGMRNLNQFDLIDPINKATVVRAAGIGGTAFSSIFSLFGFFSILAAVLLIFLIFVMLAAERRSEMGMARAIGVQRNHLVQMFTAEGLVYDFLAAALGVLIGLLVSYAMVGFIGGLFNDAVGRFSEYGGVFRFRFRASPLLIAIAYCLGVLFTFIVVTLAAWRVSRLNIVSAIRDIPEPEKSGRTARLGEAGRLLFNLLVVGAGGYLVYLGVNERFSLLLAGLSLLLAGIMFLTGQLLGRTRMRPERIQRLIYSVIGLGLLLIWALPWWNILGTAGDSVANFVADGPWTLIRLALSGPLIILGAILVIMFNADAFTGLVNRLLGGIGALTPVLKTAIAYPLSSRFRTGMAMLLFAMVISTVTLMSVVIDATRTLVMPDDERYAGFEIGLSSTLLSFFNPIGDMDAAIAQNPDFPADEVAAVGSVATTEALVSRSDRPDVPEYYLTVAGVNDGYLTEAAGAYRFALRAPGYADDAAVWEALRTRDDVGILARDMVFATAEEAVAAGDVPDFATQFGDAETQAELEAEIQGRLYLFDDFTLDSAELPPLRLQLNVPGASQAQSDLADDAVGNIEIIGVLENRSTLAGGDIQVGAPAYARLTGAPFAGTRYYLKAADGADVHAVAQAAEQSFISSGLNASVLAEQNAQGQALTRGILRLFQGFMGLGLLVGIAALGVIMTRTVVERRQQVGVMRAIGFQPRMVALSFLFEASFIALAGIVIGAFAGLSLGRQMVLTFYEAFAGNQALPIPWLQIGGIVALAYFFSLLTTIIPAYQAARIAPAEALRYE
ncbi:MAG: FtsX-like permease family protein [Caldilineaceae bacterium]|nr:FtsX-like permease family protein [Caldilineaceae bacterium]